MPTAAPPCSGTAPGAATYMQNSMVCFLNLSYNHVDILRLVLHCLWTKQDQNKEAAECQCFVLCSTFDCVQFLREKSHFSDSLLKIAGI